MIYTIIQLNTHWLKRVGKLRMILIRLNLGMYAADLGAESVFAAEKQKQKIVIEIKVFGSLSLITELEKTVGQYNIYRLFLKEIAPERVLFLAIAQDVYQDFFQRMAIKKIISDQQIKLLIFDPEREEIKQWIS